ncbi:hypothetical protein BC829DRAFT_394812, partial [Chytridium lagenaria]
MTKIICAPQINPPFGRLRPINRLRLLCRISTTCRCLRKLLAILAQNEWDVVEAINFYITIKLGRHLFGNSFDMDILRSIIGKRGLSGLEMQSILIKMVEKRDFVFTHFFLDMGAASGSDLTPVLKKAVGRHDLKMTMVVLNAGAVVKDDAEGSHILDSAISGNRTTDGVGLEIARILLARGLTFDHPVLLKSFWMYVEWNNFLPVQFMIEHGVNVNGVNVYAPDVSLRTALTKACQKKSNGNLPNANRELFDLLVSNGADVRSIPHGRKGPIAELCGSDKPEVNLEFLQHLIDIGCTVDGEEGSRALLHSMSFRRISFVEPLRKGGARANSLALYIACENGLIEVVEMFLDDGVRLNPASRRTAFAIEALTKLGRGDLAKKVSNNLQDPAGFLLC